MFVGLSGSLASSWHNAFCPVGAFPEKDLHNHALGSRLFSARPGLWIRGCGLRPPLRPLCVCAGRKVSKVLILCAMRFIGLMVI